MTRILVYGLGRSGLGMLGYLAKHHTPAYFYDDHLKADEVAQAQALGFQPINQLDMPLDTVIAAPGVPIDHPQLQAFRQRGAEVLGEAEWIYRHSPTPLIGITGTAGKTSCTLFTAYFLQALGVGAVVGGNIDPPLASVVDGAEVVACELSSFQLERIRGFRPRVAVLLNLGVDHLDRHGSLESYHAAKLNLLKNLRPEDAVVYNTADAKITAAVAACPAQKFPFEPGSGPRQTNLAAAQQAALAYAQILRREQPDYAFKLEPTASNLEALWAGAPQPEARFEHFASIGNLAFIDDSIATRIDSVRMALEAAPQPVAWILGGVDKGAPVEELREVVGRKVALILAVGRDGPRMAQAFGSTPTEVIRTADGRSALQEAVQHALGRLETGSVLLAPLGTSFDQFKDYKERSKVFRQVVREAGGA